MSVTSLKGAITSSHTSSIVITAIVLALGGSCAGANKSDLTLWLSSPTPVSAEELASASAASAMDRWISVPLTVNRELGRLEVQENDGRDGDVRAYYWQATVGDRQIVLRAGLMRIPKDTVITVIVRGITSNENRVLVQPALREDSALREVLLPFRLSSAANSYGVPWTFFGGLGLALVGLLFLVLTIREKLDYRRHDVFTKLRLWGDPTAIEAEIDRDLAKGILKYGEMWLLQNYILLNEGATDVIRYDDVVWLYAEKKFGRLGALEKAWACFVTTDGTRHKVTMPGEKEMEDVLTLLATRAPWALVGFSDEHQDQMSNDKRDATVVEILKARDHMQGVV